MRFTLASVIGLIMLIASLECNAAEVIEREIFIKNHQFIPEITNIPAGKKIRLVVHNQDPTIEEFESIDLKREKIIPGNAKAVIILAPLKVGEYKFIGEFHEDTAKGKIIACEQSPETKENQIIKQED